MKWLLLLFILPLVPLDAFESQHYCSGPEDVQHLSWLWHMVRRLTLSDDLDDHLEQSIDAACWRGPRGLLHSSYYATEGNTPPVLVPEGVKNGADTSYFSEQLTVSELLVGRTEPRIFSLEAEGPEESELDLQDRCFPAAVSAKLLRTFCSTMTKTGHENMGVDGKKRLQSALGSRYLQESLMNGLLGSIDLLWSVNWGALLTGIDVENTMHPGVHPSLKVQAATWPMMISELEEEGLGAGERLARDIRKNVLNYPLLPIFGLVQPICGMFLVHTRRRRERKGDFFKTALDGYRGSLGGECKHFLNAQSTVFYRSRSLPFGAEVTGRNKF